MRKGLVSSFAFGKSQSQKGAVIKRIQRHIILKARAPNSSQTAFRIDFEPSIPQSYFGWFHSKSWANRYEKAISLYVKTSTIPLSFPDLQDPGATREAEFNYSRLLTKTDANQTVVVDCSSLLRFGVPESAWIRRWTQFAQKGNIQITWSQIPDSFKDSVANVRSIAIPIGERPHRTWLEKWGDKTWNTTLTILGLAHLATESLWFMIRRQPGIPGEFGRQLLKLVVGAVPIVAMLCFLVGLTLAIQSAIQLEKFGASVYLASGVGISIVTEIGPLMAAVIVAGRSGSAIAAEVATMVVQEETSALRVMGVTPISYLLRPRVIALAIGQPLLTVIAQISGILAGLLVGIFYAGIPLPMFLSGLHQAIEPEYLIQSMIKAITFGFLIALIGVQSGLSAKGGAGAVGQQTTRAVVTGIAAIILADALFSFLFY